MRTILFSEDTYRGEIRTSDLICPAYGNNYLDIAFTQESQQIPDKVTIEVEGTTLSFTLPVRFSRLATEHLDGAFFNLEWLKYYAPQFGTELIEISIYADKTLLTTIEYNLTAGHGEVGAKRYNDRIDWEYDFTTYSDQIINIAPTQRTPHWYGLEVLIPKKNAEFWAGEGEIYFDVKLNNRPLSLGFSQVLPNQGVNHIEIENQGENVRAEIYTFNVSYNNCCDIEIRITNRHGLRGAIGGKFIDTSEGGDNVKSNFGTITPYNGIFWHNKKGQKIQKEVFFDCEGDVGLLELLRDACVYGVAEWYDNVTNQWLPCQVVDNSLDTDPFKEQSITFILQQL